MGDAASGAVSAKHLTTRLRAEILELREGSFLGAEEDLLARYRVSRPTLRQAARVLEHEQLLTVRRGPRGGYTVSRPHAAAVINAATLFLHGSGTTAQDLSQAGQGCFQTMARLAAASTDEQRREQLAEKFEHYRSVDFGGSAEAFLAADEAARTAVIKLAANRPLELLIEILYGCGLAGPSLAIYRDRPDFIVQARDSRARAIEAILDRDPQLAEILYLRSIEVRRRLRGERGIDLDQPPAPAVLSNRED